jgi:hypothetical protein
MGHCCNDPRARHPSIGRAMLIKGIVLERRGQKLRCAGRRGLSGVVHLAACSFSTPYTGEKKRRKKRSARDTARQENIINDVSSQCYPPGCGVSTRRRLGAQKQSDYVKKEFRKVTKMAKSVCTFMAAGAVRNRLMRVCE